MATFTLKSVQQILGDLIASVGASTPLTDINPGSVILTLLEAIATEDANTYIQMLNIIRSFNLDTTVGSDLDDRAFEYGLTRLTSKPASGYVTFSDTAFTKIETAVYTGLPGPSAGNTIVNAVDTASFPGIGGNIIVGRGTIHAETVPYVAIVNMGTFYQFTLGAPLTKDHGTDETIIFAQGGDRLVPSGTTVYVPESDLTPQINFVLQADATILDGEVEVLNNTVICTENGVIGNVNVGAVRLFTGAPFATAEVRNPVAFTSGRDVETDQELRQRIRDTIQSLSKGTITSLLTAVSTVQSEEQNNKVVSANFVEATTLNELNFMYIDDGIGLEPLFAAVAGETVIEVAAGGEKFLQLDNSKTPIAKAALVSLNQEPFGITPGQTLVIRINGIDQTMTFGGVDMFAVPGAATAEEVVIALNNNVDFIEARTADNRTRVVIEAKVDSYEGIQVVSGTSNTSLGFKTGVTVQTLKLYKNDVLLIKDGVAAQTLSAIEPGGGFGIANPSTLTIIVDNKAAVQTITFTGAVTVAEILTDINNQLSGAVGTSLITDAGTQIAITSLNPITGSSAIRVSGGTANAQLGFNTATVFGAAKDYTLNKYNGQIELESVLVAGDEVVVGSTGTRAYLESNKPENTLTPTPYVIGIGDTLVVQVDDIINSSVTTQVDASNFIDATLIPLYTTDNHFARKYVRFKNTTTTVALQGVSRLISLYEATTGQITTAAFPAVPAVGDVYEIVQIGTATANLTLTADQVQDNIASICPEIEGISFYGKQKNLDRYLRIQTNTQSNSGKIRVHAASTMIAIAKLDITASVTATSQDSNFGYLESANEAAYNKYNDLGDGYTFGRDQSCIFVIDNDLAHKTISIPMQVVGAVTTSIDASNFRDSGLIIPYVVDTIFPGTRVQFKGNTTTVAIRNEIRTVTTYNHLNGQLTVSAPFSGVPIIGDTFNILPTTTKNVVDLFNNSNFTNLGTYCDIEQSYNGTKVQIASKTQGTAGSVRAGGGTANNFNIPLLSNGTILGQFTVDTIEGLSIGLECYIDDNNNATAPITITNIVGVVSPFTITCTVDTGGTDVSMYTTDQAAFIFERNQFDFSLTPSEGVDGYKYYKGLIQQAQWTIDGKDTDITNYPGFKAAGVMIEVKAPVVNYVAVVIDITTSDGVTLAAVKSDVISSISNYINNLGVGQDIILAEIIAAVMGITGVTNAAMISPTSDIAIAVNELPRILETDIQVG